MKIVYIAHPIGGDVKNNIKKVLEICRKINLETDDVTPFIPYLSDLYCLSDDVPEERARGFKNNFAFLEKGVVDEIWLYGDRISDGMRDEIYKCVEMNIPVFAKTNETFWELNEMGLIKA